jgi:endonuclease-8
MPEGPEIRRSADRLARVLAGRRAVLVQFSKDKFPALQNAGRHLTGRMMGAIEARGKAMLTHFEGGLAIYSHNQLYGEWAVFKGPAPATHLQTRLTIATASHTAVLYSASDISVLKTSELHRHPYLAKLGVELLDPGVTVEDVLAHISQPRFARRSLAALLLDQGFLAGIGNYLRSDILFDARLHPDVRIADLAPEQRMTLARSALTLIHRSYRTRGITNDPAQAKRLKSHGWSFGRYRHWVFDRAGEHCHICDHLIRRIEAGSRGLYLCDYCQPPASNAGLPLGMPMPNRKA